MKVSKLSIGIKELKIRGILAGIQYPAIAEVKYDGELCQAIFKDGIWETVNKYGTTRTEWNKPNWPVLPCNATFYAELITGEGKSGELYTLLSNKTYDENLELRIFDIVSLNDDEKIQNAYLIDRKEVLATIFADQPDMLASFCIVEDERETYQAMNDVIAQGFEGIVVKNMHEGLLISRWVKMKYKDINKFAVVAIDPVSERIEVAVDSLDSVGKPRLVNVGVKVSNKEKANLQKGDLVSIEHQGRLSSGSLRHPVYVQKEVI